MNSQEQWKKTAEDFYTKSLKLKLEEKRYWKFSSAYEKIGELLSAEINSQIVDIGAGCGYLNHALKNLRSSILGIDISLESLKAAKTKNPESVFIQADIGNLPIKNEKLDAAASMTTIEFCFDRERSLSEINRILKKGAKFYLEVRNKNFFLFNIPKFIISFLTKAGFLEPYCAEGFIDLKYSEWQNILLKTGFEIAQTRKSLRPLNYGSPLTRMKHFLIYLVQLCTPLPQHYMVGFVCVKK